MLECRGGEEKEEEEEEEEKEEVEDEEDDEEEEEVEENEDKEEVDEEELSTKSCTKYELSTTYAIKKWITFFSHTYMTSKRIDLENPCWSGFEGL